MESVCVLKYGLNFKVKSLNCPTHHYWRPETPKSRTPTPNSRRIVAQYLSAPRRADLCLIGCFVSDELLAAEEQTGLEIMQKRDKQKAILVKEVKSSP